ncbi:MAG TPA: hypothetical protein DEA45_02900 [Acholeplasmataceae bacterium]|nr:hypothetical protein [Acholeplasmataceae bacterium]
MIDEIIINSSDIKDKPEVIRHTARAIIFIGNELVMAYSKKYNDYMFPGGGITEGEIIEDALKRELKEELGVEEILKIKELLQVIELRNYNFEYNLKQISRYFLVEAIKFGEQALEAYEMSFGLQPKYVSIDAAIQSNELEIVRREKEDVKGVHPYATLIRENKVLEFLKKNKNQINEFYRREVIK